MRRATVKEQGTAAPDRLRPDIQALRAVAVVSVLLYHLWPNRLTGGFVGVDVFFVISGFLIGGHLLAEVDRTGRVRLGRFWARRAKRLLPASLLVLLVTAVATWVVLPLSVRRDTFLDLLASAFYVQNWRLADRSVDYLAAEGAPSPVQHYWTLSTEEQFYVLVPLVLVVLALVARRLGRTPRWGAVPVLAVLALGSLGYSVHLTTAEPSVAYFSTFTRAWEFLAGALLAALVLRLGSRVRLALGVGGAVGVAAAVVGFTGTTPFPGWTALLPVLGTAAIIAAGPAGPVALAARLRPVTWVGDLSYAIYLWHWPLVVLVPYVTDVPLRTVDKLAVVVATVALAWASTRFLEDPVRFSPRLLGGGRRARTVGAWMLAATCVVAAVGVVGAQQADDEQDRLVAVSQQRLADVGPECLGAALGPEDDAPPPGCAAVESLLGPDAPLVPAPAVARRDVAPGCWSADSDTTLRVCPLPFDGEADLPADAPRVLAVGDSHNNMYSPAYEALQRERGWRIDMVGRGSCAWIAPREGATGTAQRACETWRQGVLDLLDTGVYDVVVTTSERSFVGDPARQRDQLGRLEQVWRTQVDRGIPVVALLDTPRALTGVERCVERTPDEANERCAKSAEASYPGYDPYPEAVAEVPGTALVDLNDRICAERCQPVVGGVVVFRDAHHLTSTFVRTLTPIMVQRIGDAVDEARRSLPD